MRRGPLLMLLAGIAFTAMVAAVKVARAELSAMEIIFWRGCVAAPLAFLLASRHGLQITDRRAMALRVALGFTAMLCLFTAAHGLDVADLSLLTKLRPILIAASAPLLLGIGERSPGLVWGALAVGLLGCGILLAPDLRVGSVWALWALAGTVASAGAHLTLRKMGPSDGALAIVAWFQLAVLLLSGAWLVGSGGTLLALPSVSLLPWLVGIGVAATAGQLALTRAYALDRAAVVAGAGYVTPLWAVLWDVLLFGAIPGWNVIVGGLLVIGAGLVLVVRRRKP